MRKRGKLRAQRRREQARLGQGGHTGPGAQVERRHDGGQVLAGILQDPLRIQSQGLTVLRENRGGRNPTAQATDKEDP